VPSNTLAPDAIHAINEGNRHDGNEAMESDDEAKVPVAVAIGLHVAQNEYRAFILTLNLGSHPMVPKVLGSLQQEDTCNSCVLLQKLNGILPKEAIIGTAIKPIPIHLLPRLHGDWLVGYQALSSLEEVWAKANLFLDPCSMDKCSEMDNI
jgi:hypothetical protein